MDDLFPFGRPKLCCRPRKFYCVLGTIFFFSGVDLLDNRHVDLGKDPLRFLAACSAIAMVEPVNFGGHVDSPLFEHDCKYDREHDR